EGDDVRASPRIAVYSVGAYARGIGVADHGGIKELGSLGVFDMVLVDGRRATWVSLHVHDDGHHLGIIGLVCSGRIDGDALKCAAIGKIIAAGSGGRVCGCGRDGKTAIAGVVVLNGGDDIADLDLGFLDLPLALGPAHG